MTTRKQSGYLSIVRIEGDPDHLIRAYRSTAERMHEVGRDHGLILHAAARTDDGVMIVNLWPSKEGSESAARDPRRLAALGESGVTPEQFRREHHEVLEFALFGGDK